MERPVYVENADSFGRTCHSPHGCQADAHLVLAARDGDKRAFVEIVIKYQAMVCGIALGIIGDFATSEDIAQEAFLTAWRKLDQLREPERLRGWLAQVARSVALGDLRRRRSHESLEAAIEIADESPTPDQIAATADETALVRKALADLHETYRLPLVLFYRQGQSIRAVSEALGLSEDAVKKRLERGRTMLHEHVSEIVESVLTRTGPTAVFTVTIASLIGAVAAPTTVAASVFTTSVTSNAASAGSTSSISVLTLMSTSKTLIITTALLPILTVPIGYRMRFGQQSPAPATMPVASQVKLLVSATNSAPLFADSALFVEWRKLHEIYGTGSESMPEIYRAIGDIKDSFRRRAFTAALISEWAQVDPPGGLAFFRTKVLNKEQGQQLFAEWLQKDPKRAVDGLVASGAGWEVLAHDSLPEIARRVPASVPEIVAHLSKPDNYWDTKVRDAFTVLAESDLDGTRKAAEGLRGPNREQALAGVASAWAKVSPDNAIAWAKSLPDGVDRNEVIRSALVGLATVNPTSALDEIGTIPAGGKQFYFATTTGARVLQEAAKTDFEGTVAWIATHPGRLTPEDLLGIAHVVTDGLNVDPAGFLSSRAADGSLRAIVPAISSALLNDAAPQRTAVWDWLRTQPFDEASKALTGDVLRGTAWHDPQLALRMAADLPTGREGDSEMKSLATDLLNGGSWLNRFDGLTSEAPDRLRQALTQAAFSMLRGENIEDPQLWIGRLGLLPESERASGVQAVARAWAQNSPENAISWVRSLPADSARSSAVAAIASAWATKDERNAAQWVASIAPGPDRDQSARALALSIADHDPRGAWQWAVTIGDESERDRATTQVAKTIATRDLAAARQLVQESALRQDAKLQLLITLK